MTPEEYYELPALIRLEIELALGSEQQLEYSKLQKLADTLETMGYEMEYDLSGEIVSVIEKL